MKETLLDAAEEVALRDGVTRLTFDAVAAEAGVSKGGVLHHFSSKDQLLEALVKRVAENWRQFYLGAYENTPQGPGRMTRALLNYSFRDCAAWAEQMRRSFSSTLAATVHNPSLVRAIREAGEELQGYLRNDGLPEGIAEVIGAAIDGVWLNWALRFTDVDDALLQRLHGALEPILERALREVGETSSAGESRAKG